MKIRYNAPVVLNYTLVAVLVLFINPILGGDLITAWFIVPGRGYFDTGSIICKFSSKESRPYLRNIL